MSQKEILSIAIKVFAIWFLCELFLHVSAVLPLTLSSMGRWQGNEIPTLFYIAICLTFLVSGFIIAKLLFSVSTSALDKLSSKTDIFLTETGHKFILQVCGLCFFALPSLIGFPSSFSFLVNPEAREIPWYYYFMPVQYLIQFVLGAWLIVHPSWWGLLLAKFRGRA